jgi:hypothetical protein
MTKNYFILSIIIVAAGIFSFQNSGNEKIEKYLKKNGHKYPNGIGIGSVAGAPGESNCTSCHSGSTQSGASINTLTLLSGTTPVTFYTPGSTYNVGLTMTPNPTRRGFQAVAMNSSDAVVGTFTALVGARIVSNRAMHSSTADAAWTWKWTAPSTDVGTVTFYVATMKAGGSSNQTGDVVYLSQHVIGSAASISEEIIDKYNFSAGYSATDNSVLMNFNSLVQGDMYFNLIDLSGRSVFTYSMGQSVVGKNSEKIVLPEDLKNGMYVVNMFVNNNAMEKKIIIQK